MAAGLGELHAVGYEALTIRAVAQRAGVSRTTAYAHLSSKNHLFAELFRRHLKERDETGEVGEDATGRLRVTVRALTARIASEPELAAAVTPALLGDDPDLAWLRRRIGAEFYSRFQAALAGSECSAAPAGGAVLDALVLTFTGALLQVGMDLLTYEQMADRLVSIVELITRGTA